MQRMGFVVLEKMGFVVVYGTVVLSSLEDVVKVWLVDG